MVFKDINTGFYLGKRSGLYAATIEEVEHAGEAFGIVSGAYMNLERTCGTILQTNDITRDFCRQKTGRFPVLRLLPPGYPEESYTPEEITRLATEEKALFRICPAQDVCPVTTWMFDWMPEVLSETRTPLLISLQELDLRDAAELKMAYPLLRLVITNTTQWMNRQYLRFAQYFSEVYIDTTNIIEYHGLENIVKLLGAHRLLFGTYSPEKEPYDKVFQMMHCDLSQEQKQLIAFGNFERLVEER
jgi:hypothetical protein